MTNTSYCCTSVVVDPTLGLSLYVDGNSKVTAGNGTFEDPAPNALSLPHIATCPGSTPTCRSTCYVHGLQANAPDVYKQYQHNERTLHRILLASTTVARTALALGQWIGANCSGGFRWHVSGDVFSDHYAEWIARVVKSSAPVKHWIYTRTLDYRTLEPFRFLGNLTVNISTDQDTYQEARELATREGFRLCYLTVDGSLPQDLPEGSVIFPDYSLRGRGMKAPTEHDWWQGLTPQYRKMVCPADFFGQSEQHRCGVCQKCMVP